MILLKKDKIIEEILKGYGTKNYSTLRKVPIIDKNGVRRMVYVKQNKDNILNPEKTKTSGENIYSNIIINVNDLKNAVTELKIKNPEELLESFKNYNAKGRTGSQIWEDLRRLASLNLAASKGYMRYNYNNDEIYETKNRVIKQIIKNQPSDILIKTDKEKSSTEIPEIIYFEKDNKQISFHLPKVYTKDSVLNSGDNHDHKYWDNQGNLHFSLARTDDNEIFVEDLVKLRNNQTSKGVWNEKPGDYLISDYSKIEKLAKINKLLEKSYSITKTDTIDYVKINVENTYKNQMKKDFFGYKLYGLGGYDLAKPDKYDNIINSNNQTIEMLKNEGSYEYRNLKKKSDDAKTTQTKKKYAKLAADVLENDKKDIQLLMQENEGLLNVKKFILTKTSEINAKKEKEKKNVETLENEKRKLIDIINNDEAFITKSL